MGIVPDQAFLSPEHLAELRESGLTDETIKAAGLKTLNGRDEEIVRRVLGPHIDAKTVRKMGACLAFPYVDAAGKPMAFTDRAGKSRWFLRLKFAQPREDRKEKGKKIKYESPAGTPCRAYFPPQTRPVLSDTSVPLIITEGEKKSLCADQHGLPCIGLGGVWAWQVKREEDDDGNKTGPRELIPDLAKIAWEKRTVTVVFDSDVTTNPNVSWARWHLAQALISHGADVRVVDLPDGEKGAKVGIDDYVVANGPEKFRELVAGAKPPVRPAAADDRPEIVISTEEHEVNMLAVATLAPMPDLYQRGGLLARVIYTDDTNDPHAAVRRPPGAPVVRDLPQALLRERMTRCARWVAVRQTQQGPVKVPAHPPDWSVSAVHARGQWPGVRHLEAVVNHPVILPDGSILKQNGYDKQSRLLVSIPDGLRIPLVDNPNAACAAAAASTINDVIADFPFEKPEHRAAWFAGLLTPLAWFAFDGPAPMTLIDGNVRGVGKGLLADLISIVLTGRRFSVMSYTSDKEELRKKITSVAMEGERLVLLDNLAGAVGNDVLDMALTADRWKDRVLGVNKVYDGPLHVTWFATGNNVELRADTARRCSHCRLETPDEHPEFKAGFKYEDLRRHVREMRGELLSAAITILKAWFVAGKPRHGLNPWGSFEGWSAIVREAVVFAGLPDPGETRMSLLTSADRDANTMGAMIAAMEKLDDKRAGKTTAEIVDAALQFGTGTPEWQPELKAAVEELCGRLDGRTLSYKFRQFGRRNFGGKMIDKARAGHGGVIRWAVFPAGPAASTKTSPPSPPSPPPETIPTGGDGDNGGDVPAQNGKPTPNGRLGKRRFKSNSKLHNQRES